MRERLLETLAAAGVSVEFCPVVVGPGVVVIYRAGATQTQIDNGNAIITTFDWSDAAQTAWLRSKLQAAAIAALDNADILGKIITSLFVLIPDQLNLLRGQFIGGAAATWDPASIANGAELSSPNVTVVGAAFGDVVDVAAPYSLQGMFAQASVVAADTVAIRLRNGTGGTINLLSGNWKVGVRRPMKLDQLQMSDVKNAAITAILNL